MTIAFAKRHGTNAVAVAEGLIRQVEALEGVAIPSSVNVTHHAKLRRDRQREG